MAQVENENEDEDDWINEGEDGIWIRKHKIGRRVQFTQCGTEESPKRPSSLGSARITEGTYAVSSESFIIVDDWRDKRDARRRLAGAWTGRTTFEVGLSLGPPGLAS